LTQRRGGAKNTQRIALQAVLVFPLRTSAPPRLCVERPPRRQTLALAWVGGLPGGAPAAALLPLVCALLLWWGVGRVEAERRSSATSADQS